MVAAAPKYFQVKLAVAPAAVVAVIPVKRSQLLPVTRLPIPLVLGVWEAPSLPALMADRAATRLSSASPPLAVAAAVAAKFLVA